MSVKRIILKFIFLGVLLFFGCGKEQLALQVPIIGAPAGSFISGTAFKGPVSNGVVDVWSLESDGTLSHLIASGKTDKEGKFLLPLPKDFSGPVTIKVKSGTYTEEASGEIADLSKTSLYLSGIAVVNPKEKLVSTVITPLTSLSTEMMKYESKEGGDLKNIVELTNARIGTFFGLGGISHIIPADPTDDILDHFNEPAGKYGLILAALSKTAKRHNVTTMDLMSALVQDASDCDLDGKSVDKDGNPKEIKIPKTNETLTATELTSQFAMDLEDFIASSQNKSGIKKADIENFLKELREPKRAKVCEATLIPKVVPGLFNIQDSKNGIRVGFSVFNDDKAKIYFNYGDKDNIQPPKEEKEYVYRSGKEIILRSSTYFKFLVVSSIGRKSFIDFKYDFDLQKPASPSISLTPQNSFYNATRKMKIELSDSTQEDERQIFYSFSGDDFSDLTISNIYLYQNAVEVEKISGKVWAVLLDKAKNVSSVTKPVLFTFDDSAPTEPPQLTWTPQNKGNTYNREFKVDFTSTEAGTDIYYRDDGQDDFSDLASAQIKKYDTAIVKQGVSGKIVAVEVDLARNIGPKKEIEFTFDNRAPVHEPQVVLAPQNGANHYNQDLTITLSKEETDSDIYYREDGKDDFSDLSASEVKKYDASIVKQGVDGKIVAVEVDTAQNIGPKKEIVFTFDNRAPASAPQEVLAPQNQDYYYNRELQITLQKEEPNSDIYYREDGAEDFSNLNAPEVKKYNAAIIKQGTHGTITSVEVDRARNIGPVKRVSYFFDNSAPQVQAEAIFNPSNKDNNFNGTFKISLAIPQGFIEDGTEIWWIDGEVLNDLSKATKYATNSDGEITKTDSGKITVALVDKARNIGLTKTIEFIKDVQAPQVQADAVFNPSNRDNNFNGTFKITLNIPNNFTEDGTEIWWIDGEVLNDLSKATKYATNSDGEITKTDSGKITVALVDKARNIGALRTIVFVKDNSAPQVQAEAIFNPSNKDNNFNYTFKITLNIPNNFTEDGTEIWWIDGEVLNDLSRATKYATNSDGEITKTDSGKITVALVDKARNIGLTKTIEFIKDNDAPAAPTIALSASPVIRGQVYSYYNASQTLSVSMQDTSGEAAELLISFDNQAFAPYTGPIQKNGLSGSVQAKVKDKAQNESLVSQAVQFFYDNDLPSAPQITFDADHPEGFYNDTGIQVTFTDTSNDGILTYYQYGSNDFSNLQDAKILNINQKNHTESITVRSNTIYAIVVDKAGNQSLVSGPRAITYDTKEPAAPSITISSLLLKVTDNHYKDPLTVSIASTANEPVSLLCSLDAQNITTPCGDISPISAQDGPLYAKAKDRARNFSSVTESVAFTYDPEPPELFVMSNDQQDGLYGASFTLNLSSSENGFIRCNFDGTSPTVEKNDVLIQTIENESHGITIGSRVENLLRCRAWDLVENVTTQDLERNYYIGSFDSLLQASVNPERPFWEEGWTIDKVYFQSAVKNIHIYADVDQAPTSPEDRVQDLNDQLKTEKTINLSLNAEQSATFKYFYILPLIGKTSNVYSREFKFKKAFNVSVPKTTFLYDTIIDEKVPYSIVPEGLNIKKISQVEMPDNSGDIDLGNAPKDLFFPTGVEKFKLKVELEDDPDPSKNPRVFISDEIVRIPAQRQWKVTSGGTDILKNPVSVVTQGPGGIYFIDYVDNTYFLMKISADNTVEKVFTFPEKINGNSYSIYDLKFDYEDLWVTMQNSVVKVNIETGAIEVIPVTIFPQKLAIGNEGEIYLSDSSKHCIQKLAFDTVTSQWSSEAWVGVCDYNNAGYSANDEDSNAKTAKLNKPSGLTVAPDGSLYIADTGNQRIRKVYRDNTGTFKIKTFIGWANQGIAIDNTVRNASDVDFSYNAYPSDIVSTSDNGFYITAYDTGQSAYEKKGRVYRVFNDNGIYKIYSIAGGGNTDANSPNANNSAAQNLKLNDVTSVSTFQNSIYFLDYTARKIFKVTKNVQTNIWMAVWVAGKDDNGISSGDGGLAQQAKLNYPSQLQIDSSGNQFMQESNSYKIRKIDYNSKIISQIFTNANNFWSFVIGENDGTIYLADYFNHKLRKYSNNTLSDVFTNAQFFAPNSLVMDQEDGILYLLDRDGNNWNGAPRLRKVGLANQDVVTLLTFTDLSVNSLFLDHKTLYYVTLNSNGTYGGYIVWKIDLLDSQLSPQRVVGLPIGDENKTYFTEMGHPSLQTQLTLPIRAMAADDAHNLFILLEEGSTQSPSKSRILKVPSDSTGAVSLVSNYALAGLYRSRYLVVNKNVVFITQPNGILEGHLELPSPKVTLSSTSYNAPLDIKFNENLPNGTKIYYTLNDSVNFDDVNFNQLPTNVFEYTGLNQLNSANGNLRAIAIYRRGSFIIKSPVSPPRAIYYDVQEPGLSMTENNKDTGYYTAPFSVHISSNEDGVIQCNNITYRVFQNRPITVNIADGITRLRCQGMDLALNTSLFLERAYVVESSPFVSVHIDPEQEFWVQGDTIHSISFTSRIPSDEIQIQAKLEVNSSNFQDISLDSSSRVGSFSPNHAMNENVTLTYQYKFPSLANDNWRNVERTLSYQDNPAVELTPSSQTTYLSDGLIEAGIHYQVKPTGISVQSISLLDNSNNTISTLSPLPSRFPDTVLFPLNMESFKIKAVFSNGRNATSELITKVPAERKWRPFVGEMDSFQYPSGLAVSERGVLYYAQNKWVKRVDGEGQRFTVGEFDGSITDIAFKNDGPLYVLAGNKIYTLNVLTGEKNWIAGNGSYVWNYQTNPDPEGDALTTPLGDNNGEKHLAIGNNGIIYMTDSRSFRVRMIYLDADGILKIKTLVGKNKPWGQYNYTNNGDGGLAENAQMTAPLGIAVDSSNNIYVIDQGIAYSYYKSVIRKIYWDQNVDDFKITTIAGGGTTYDVNTSMPATQAALHALRSLAVASDDSVYISYNDGIQHLYDNNGTLYVEPVLSGSGINLLSTHVFVNNSELELYFSTYANIYVNNYGYASHKIKKFLNNQTTDIVTNVVPPQFTMNGSPSAMIENATHFYVSGNRKVYKIKKDDRTIVQLPFDTAQDNYSNVETYGLSLDSKERLYVARYYSSDYNVIQRLELNNTITKVIGEGPKPCITFNCPRIAATTPLVEMKLNNTKSIAIDEHDRMYLADTGNNQIRTVDLNTNTISTLLNTNSPQLVSWNRGNLFFNAGSYINLFNANEGGAESVIGSSAANQIGSFSKPFMFDDRGNIFILSDSYSKIFKYDRQANTASQVRDFSSGALNYPSAILASGSTMYVGFNNLILEGFLAKPAPQIILNSVNAIGVYNTTTIEITIENSAPTLGGTIYYSTNSNDTVDHFTKYLQSLIFTQKTGSIRAVIKYGDGTYSHIAGPIPFMYGGVPNAD